MRYLILVVSMLALAVSSPAVADFARPGIKLKGTGGSLNTAEGQSSALSADGNTAIVGGPGDGNSDGASWIFVRTGSAWTQQGLKLVGTGATGFARQGASVSIAADGNTAIVGGPGDNAGDGAAWIFVRNAGVWTQQGGKLIGAGGGVQFPGSDCFGREWQSLCRRSR